MIEGFLERVKADADRLGVYLKPSLPAHELNKTAQAIRAELGLVIPDDYMRLLRVTNGIETQRGYLSPLQVIGEQNAVIWFMQSKAGADAKGDFVIRYEPLESPPTPKYIWLGYDGNSSEQIYVLATGEFHRRGLGCESLPPDNHDRSLVGMLDFMIYGEQAPE